MPDLATQRLVKAALTQAPAPYTEEELRKIATHCTERENASRKVERKMRKVAAAVCWNKGSEKNLMRSLQVLRQKEHLPGSPGLQLMGALFVENRASGLARKCA